MESENWIGCSCITFVDITAVFINHTNPVVTDFIKAAGVGLIKSGNVEFAHIFFTLGYLQTVFKLL